MYPLTIFVSAFLLFQVQPMVGKFILPWFGGTPGVWTTCMLFFQLLLLGGYTYAHLLNSYLSRRAQATLHLMLLVLSVTVLHVRPAESWKPEGLENPVWHILLLLAFSVGAPYFMLSTTGPLLQRWYSRLYPHRSPYPLYALSNVGSLLALISYPFIVEPNQSLGLQATCWSWTYVFFLVSCIACLIPMLAVSLSGDASDDEAIGKSPNAAAAARAEATPDVAGPPTYADAGLWLSYGACGSLLLLATTNQMCQDVAVVPFLWVLPLTLYLLSFILCFESDRIYIRFLWIGSFIALLPFAVVVLFLAASAPIFLAVTVLSLTLFVGCMICHGELARMRPAPRYLTGFFLMIAAGGALGGTMVSLVGPAFFQHYWEYHLALVGTMILIFATFIRESRAKNSARFMWLELNAVAVSTLILLGALGAHLHYRGKDVQVCRRNFYGVLQVARMDYGSPEQSKYVHYLYHGSIIHGFQYFDEGYQQRPVSYFGEKTGIGQAVVHHPRRAQGLRIGVLGLGVGTMAAYGQKGDSIRFYEINPDVLELAQSHFTYLKDSRAKISIALGDGRIQLERELQQEKGQKFDLLLLDAFSSDAIPMHLLTKEACDIYWQHLKPDGILAVNVTNRFVRIDPVVRGPAEERGKTCVYISNAPEGDDAEVEYSSAWVLVTSNTEFLSNPHVLERSSRWVESDGPAITWTDDYSNLFQILLPQDTYSDTKNLLKQNFGVLKKWWKKLIRQE